MPANKVKLRLLVGLINIIIISVYRSSWKKTEVSCAALPKPEYIARQANLLRQKLRPEHPGDLELVDECLPDGFSVLTSK